MKKFDLYEGTLETKNKKEISTGCTIDKDSAAHIIKSFDTKEEALEELKKKKNTIEDAQGYTGRFIRYTEYFILDQEYDEDGYPVGDNSDPIFAEDD